MKHLPKTENAQYYHLDVDDEIVTKHIVVKGVLRGAGQENNVLNVSGQINIVGRMQIKAKANDPDPDQNVPAGTLILNDVYINSSQELKKILKRYQMKKQMI